MGTTIRGSSWGRCAILCAAATVAYVAAAEAKPVTIHLATRLTLVCDQFPVVLAACTPDASIVHFTIEYDPDTLVLDTSSPFRTVLKTTSVTYTISLATLEDPWGGTVVRQSEATAEFALEPFGDSAAGVKILDSVNIPGCAADGACDRWWLTALEFSHFFHADPVTDPTAKDFRAMLKHPEGPGSVFDFMTVAFYTRAGDTERTYLPGSRFYYSNRVEHSQQVEGGPR